MTTKTKQALAWLALGKPRASMAADLGITPQEAKQMINYLQRRGYIQAIPATYALTERGQERAAYVPTSTNQARAHQRMLHRMKSQESAEKMVARAKRSPSNFIFNLAGGMQ
jgi:predicted transcriptional regulator